MWDNKNSERVEVDVDLVCETKDAYCVKIDEDTFEQEAKRIWVPKSLSELDDGTLTVAEWFAIKVGLV